MVDPIKSAWWVFVFGCVDEGEVLGEHTGECISISEKAGEVEQARKRVMIKLWMRISARARAK